MNAAITEAIETQRVFSWIKGRYGLYAARDVQAGVYLKWSQEYFQTYKLKVSL